MRTLRLVALFAGIALLATSVWSGVAGARERERDALDGKLQRHAEGASRALEAYFERARALTLMLSRNDAFTSFYAAPGTRLEKLSAGGPTMDAVASARLRGAGTL